jgi:hypothetical protein
MQDISHKKHKILVYLIKQHIEHKMHRITKMSIINHLRKVQINNKSYKTLHFLKKAVMNDHYKLVSYRKLSNVYHKNRIRGQRQQQLIYQTLLKTETLLPLYIKIVRVHHHLYYKSLIITLHQ